VRIVLPTNPAGGGFATYEVLTRKTHTSVIKIDAKTRAVLFAQPFQGKFLHIPVAALTFSFIQHLKRQLYIPEDGF
jgi:hypothetical protein